MRGEEVWRRAAVAIVALVVSAVTGCHGDRRSYVIDLGAEHRLLTDADDPRFAAPDFDDSGWRAVTLPTTWRVRTLGNAVYGWHRFHFVVPEDAPSVGLALDLGVIAWSDEVFLNGERIGGIGRMRGVPRLGPRPRLYPVPDGALRPGPNVLAVRIHGIPMGVSGLFADRAGIGDRLELERALARSLSKTEITEGLLMGFLGFGWLVVAFFPKRGRPGRATLFLIATITFAMVMLWLLSVTFRINGLGPDVGANVLFCALCLAGTCYWGFVAIVTRGRVPGPMKAVMLAEGGVALLFPLLPGGVGALLFAAFGIGTVALPLLFGYLGSAVRARTPGAIPIVFGCALPAASVLGMVFLPSPFAAGLPFIHYGLVAAIACAVLALTRHVHAMNRQVQRATEYALEAHGRERNRLARDLHDGLGQMLALLKMQLQRLGRKHQGEPAQQSFDDSADQVAATLDELRRIARDLRPTPMEDRKLGDAVREYAAAITRRSEMVVEVEGEYASPMSDDVGDELYRIAQECLTNCIKHSEARRVVVTLAEVGDRFELVVVDDGRGLPESRTDGLGLTTIRERSELLGGTCVIAPASGGGTRIEVSVPR